MDLLFVSCKSVRGVYRLALALTRTVFLGLGPCFSICVVRFDRTIATYLFEQVLRVARDLDILFVVGVFPHLYVIFRLVFLAIVRLADR